MTFPSRTASNSSEASAAASGLQTGDGAPRPSGSRFDALVRATAQIVWSASADGALTEDSPTWRAYTGQTWDELRGMGCVAAIHPDDREAAARAWARSVETHGIYEAEYRLRRADGAYRWMAARAAPVPDASGAVREWIGVNNDIHDRKLAELERQRFVSLAERSTDFIGMADLELQPFFVNRAAVELVGGSSTDELIRTPVEEYFFPEDREFIVNRFFPQAIAQGGNQTEIRFRHFRTGEAIWMIYSVYTLVDEQGNVMGHATVSRDITERKKTEERLRNLAADLSAEDRRKMDFLATLAHELRNPLAPIRNGLEILRLAGSDPAATARVQQMMHRQVDQMVHLINDLLDVSRINSGKIELRREVVELSTVVASAVEAILPVIDSAQHELTVHLPDEPLLLHVDPMRLGQVLGNVLTNAVKYTPSHGRIELTACRDEGDAMICVRDNGIGIPAEYLQSVFGMFTQVQSHVNRAQGGLGIGLSLVQRLVEMHGGSVSARSDGEGHGSTICIRLPLAGGHGALAHLPAGTASVPDTGAAPLRIVVADDNVDAAESLAMLLRLRGHDVIVGHDGQQALDLIAAHQPDVAFLDIGMPMLNGYEVAERVAGLAGVARPVLCAVTGWGAEPDRRRAHEAGFTHHIAKPASAIDIDRLLTALPTAVHAAC